ncbi:MAG: hypothetical protein WA864_10965 [Acetobacteraceae bacterium]
MDKTERIARKLLPAAALTAALPMVPAIYAPFVPGWSEPQPMHQPDEPAQHHQAPDFGQGTAGITASGSFTGSGTASGSFTGSYSG